MFDGQLRLNLSVVIRLNVEILRLLEALEHEHLLLELPQPFPPQELLLLKLIRHDHSALGFWPSGELVGVDAQLARLIAQLLNLESHLPGILLGRGRGELGHVPLQGLGVS